MNFSVDFDVYKSKYEEVANEQKSKGISFLMSDLGTSQGALQVCMLLLTLTFLDC